MKVSVVIPCYRVKGQILGVLEKIGPEVAEIYVIDDGCPEGTGDWVESQCHDERLRLVRNSNNLGVGGATLAGFRQAWANGSEIVVKLDGDGQMDPKSIPKLIRPIQEGRADYTKGNRFFSPSYLKGMPVLRIIGNSALSFFSKISSGYWRVMDPTNGFVAIHTRILGLLPLERIENRYFFESDLLFRLNTIRAVVTDVPLPAIYRDEKSSLRVHRELFSFFLKHTSRFIKRISYGYFVRDFNIASVEILGAATLLTLGVSFGLWEWVDYSSRGAFAPTGTIMLSALLVILGFQLLLSAISFDILHEPNQPLHPLL